MLHIIQSTVNSNLKNADVSYPMAGTRIIFASALFLSPLPLPVLSCFWWRGGVLWSCRVSFRAADEPLRGASAVRICGMQSAASDAVLVVPDDLGQQCRLGTRLSPSRKKTLGSASIPESRIFIKKFWVVDPPLPPYKRGSPPPETSVFLERLFLLGQIDGFRLIDDVAFIANYLVDSVYVRSNYFCCFSSIDNRRKKRIMATQLTAGFVSSMIKYIDVASAASSTIHQMEWEAGELIRAEFGLDQKMKITDAQYGLCAGKIAKAYTTQLAAYAADDKDFDASKVDVVASVRSFLASAVRCRKMYETCGLVGVFGGATPVMKNPKPTVLPTAAGFAAKIKKSLTPAQIKELIALLS